MRPPPFVPAALCFLSLVLAPAVSRAGWPENLSSPDPGGFPPLKPLKLSFQGGWSGFTAAEIEMKFGRPAPGISSLEARAATVGLVRTLWRLDATHTARADLATLKPIDVQQVEVYRAQTIHTTLQFHDGAVTRLRESTAEKNPARHKTYTFPNLYDLQSALLYVRSQKLAAGQKFSFVVYPGTAAYLATVTVLGRETIKVKAGSYPAIKLDLRLQKITPELTLEPHAKFKRATGWFSDDQDRLPLRLSAQIFVGSVWAELEKPPQPLD